MHIYISIDYTMETRVPDSIQKLLSVDLNLLVVLHAIIETGSTVGAAAKIGRTQPAISLALKRLRTTFDDPLFIRVGARLEPTKLTIRLEQPLQRLLNEASSLLTMGKSFDPATSDRQVVVAIAENAHAIAVALTAAIHAEAPNMRVKISAFDLEATEYGPGISQLMSGELDLILSFYRNDVPSGLQLHQLDTQSWATFVRHDHPISDTPDMNEWTAYPHIQIITGPSGRNAVDTAVAAQDAARHIGLQVHSFLQALSSVAMSDMLLTTMVPVVYPISQKLGLREIKTPLDMPDVPMCFISRATRHDPFSKWLAAKMRFALTSQT